VNYQDARYLYKHEHDHGDILRGSLYGRDSALESIVHISIRWRPTAYSELPFPSTHSLKAPLKPHVHISMLVSGVLFYITFLTMHKFIMKHPSEYVHKRAYYGLHGITFVFNCKK
jgi:hypothetical protein